jgi:hypothetical protein
MLLVSVLLRQQRPGVDVVQAAAATVHQQRSGIAAVLVPSPAHLLLAQRLAGVSVLQGLGSAWCVEDVPARCPVVYPVL